MKLIKILKVVQAVGLAGATAILVNPDVALQFVPPPYKLQIGAGIALVSAFLPGLSDRLAGQKRKNAPPEE